MGRLFASLFCLLSFITADAASQMLPFRIVNNSGLAPSEVYVTIFGFNEPAARVTPMSPRKQGFIQISNGVGSFVNADPSTPSTTFCYPLSSFPQVEGAYQITIPWLDSGELFFSLHEPLTITVNFDSTIANPDPANPYDPSYGYIYDKMEFSFEPPNVGSPPLNQVTVNVTSVDFFSLPIFITLPGASPSTTGTKMARQTILDDLQNAFKKGIGEAQSRWNSLIVPTQEGSSIARILSPGMGLKYSFPEDDDPRQPAYFDVDYLCAWLHEIWAGPKAYYKDANHVLTVETVVNKLKYYGRVNKESNCFEFWTKPDLKGAPSVVLPAPACDSNTATKIIFAAFAPWPGSYPATQDTYDIGRLIQAGIITGYLPCADILSTEALMAAASATPSPLYTVNPNLSPALQTIGPFYDLYSAALFPDCNGAYAWPWDDLIYLSAAPSLAVWQPSTYVEIELGKCE